MQYDFSQLKQKYATLPEDVRNAISSVGVANTLESIGKKYRLHVDQAGELYDETGLVMLGLTHPKDYIRNIQKRLVIDGDIAKKIAADVNEQIFRLIKESLKKIHSIEESKPEPQKERETDGQTAKQEKPRTAPVLILKKQDVPPLGTKEKPIPDKGASVLKQRLLSLQEKPTLDTEETPTLDKKTEPQHKQKFFTITPKTKKLSSIDTSEPQKEIAAKSPANLPMQKNDGEIAQKLNMQTMQRHIADKKDTHKNKKPLRDVESQTSQTSLGKIMESGEPELKPHKTPTPSIASIEKKLSGTFKLPRTETEYKTPKKPQKPNTRIDYRGGDPYREPID